MKKLQSSAAAKACAWLLLLAAAFGGSVFGIRMILSMDSVLSESWQTNSRYYNALGTRKQELIEGMELALTCEELEQRFVAGQGGEVLYVDLEALREQRDAVEQRFSRENTWFRFRIVTGDGQRVLGTNLQEEESLLKAVREVRTQTLEIQDGHIVGYSDSPYWYDYGEIPVQPEEADPAEEDGAADQPEVVQLVLEYGVPEEVDPSIQDEFCWIWQNYDMERTAFQEYLTGFLLLGALAFAALVWILWTAGHRPGSGAVFTGWQERVFFDVYAAAMIAVGVICLFAAIWATEMVYHHSMSTFYWVQEDYDNMELYSWMGLLGAGALCTGMALAAALLLRTLAVRIKAGCLRRTTLLYRVAAWTLRSVHEFVLCLPLTWKVVLSFGAYVLVTLVLGSVGRYDGVFMLLWWFIQAVMLVFLAWWTYSYHRLRQGTKTIAKGDLEYQIDTRRMPSDLRLQAEDLNNISAGLSAAVDEKIKSERFKAELITNVSHDLKTPLTSIINYVNLLKSTEQTDPKAAEYIEVLDRKSQRLKKLTEDLVEASKASTGVLTVAREKIGMSQLIDQALGEWEERLTAQRLTLVSTLPEGETWVYADGRHLWRVIDNLLSNCSKYALEGTRVYLDLARGKGQVVLSVKNISREALNVPAERLMERFVRGEESRSTEGSGLGLSIARSLTELQGGSFELAVDGDLFKAIVTLPQAN